MKVKAAIFFFILLILGCSNSDNGSPKGVAPANSLTVTAADRYLYNATFFHDANENGLWDEGELISPPTDLNGKATFPAYFPKGEIITQLSNGTMDGIIYWTKMRAITNGTDKLVISPMTTLLANGLTEEQLVDLFQSAGITVSAEDLYKNPMENRDLMVANAALAQGLLATYKGFSLSPSDIESNRLANANAQKIFEDSAKIYSLVITPEKFNGNLTDLSKETSSLFDYINRFGTQDFIDGSSVNTTSLSSAENAILEKLKDSTNAFEPIVLNPSDTNFSATVLRNTWFKPGNYDLLGFNFKHDVSRIVNGTIGNYPQGPHKIRINFIASMVNKNKLNAMCYQSKAFPDFTYSFDSQNNEISMEEKVMVEDGEPAKNVDYSRGLPISANSFTSNLNFKSFSSDENLRLIGVGNSVTTYYGVDIDNMTINTSRTNNCLIGDSLNISVTNDCSASDVSIFYNSQKNESAILTNNALTSFSEAGATPTFSSFSFLYKNRKLVNINLDEPKKYKISDLKIVPGNLVLDLQNCATGRRCLRVVGDGDTVKREQMTDSVDLQYLIGYDYFPAGYNIYALNSLKIQIADGDFVEVDVSKYSGFYKGGMIFLKLPKDTLNSPMEYIILDLVSKQGAALSKVNDWLENGLLKFQYRDIEKIEIKELIQENIPFAIRHLSGIKYNACNFLN